MAGFSVEDHRAWRQARAPAEPVPSPRNEPPEATAPEVAPASQDLEARLRALGVVGLPARLHDAAFGRWARGGFYHAVRFLLVVATVLLVVGGVQADAPVTYEVGDYTSVTPYSTLDAYPTPQFTYEYQVDVGRARGPGTSAFFDHGHGVVRLPELGAETRAYALFVNIVRVDDVEPVLLVKSPGGAYGKQRPVEDDGVRMVYDPIRIDDAGQLGLLITSVGGKGSVHVQLAVAEAPVTERALMTMAKVGPIAAGSGLGLLLLGAYAPGATMLRERRRRTRDAMDAVYVENRDQQPTGDSAGHARINWGRPGVMAWKRPGKQSAERLAELPGPGWVIRLD